MCELGRYKHLSKIFSFFTFLKKKTKNVGKVTIHKNIESDLGFEEHPIFT